MPDDSQLAFTVSEVWFVGEQVPMYVDELAKTLANRASRG